MPYSYVVIKECRRSIHVDPESVIFYRYAQKDSENYA